MKSKPKRKTAGKARAVHFADVDLNEDSVDEAEVHAEDELASGESDEEEEEEGDPSEFVDVLDVLDGRGEPDSGDDMGEVERGGQVSATVNRRKAEDEEVDKGDVDDDMEGSADDSDEQSDEEEGGNIVSASEDEGGEGDDSALQELENFVSGLDAGQKRKAPDEDDAQDGGDSKPARKRRLLRERTEAGAENEFAAALGTFYYAHILSCCAKLRP